MTATERAPVVVIGGGLAGLSAAIHLPHGHDAVVLDAAAHAGGQCTATPDRGARRDSGVHGVYPRYSELRRLLSLTGTPERELPVAAEQMVVTPDGRLSPVRMARMPAPAHCLAHVARLRVLGVAERMRLATGSARLLGISPQRDGLDAMSLTELVHRTGIPPEAFRIVYEPLAWIGFFLSPDELSAAAYLDALRFLIVGRSDSWRARWAAPPNDRWLVEPLVRRITASGGRVRFASRATRVRFCDGRATAVETTDERGRAELIEASAVVCAVPPVAAATLLDRAPGAGRLPDRLRRLGTTAVTTYHFVFGPGPQPKAKHGVALTDEAGFVFFSLHDVFGADRGSSRRIEVQCGPTVASAGVERLERRVRALLPDGAAASLHGIDHVTTSPYARFGVGSECDRPSIRTPWPNVHFAGDWVTEPGGSWFMERAVRTGRLAAESFANTPWRPPPVSELDGVGVRLARRLAPRARL